MSEDPFEGVSAGEVIGGYRLERLLGAGSTSSVFLAKHVRLGRRAAIKVLAPELLSSKDTVARLLNEARVVNDIGHPNIVDIIDFVESESPPRVALVMEYIEGPSLKVLREHPFSYEQALGISLQLVAAIQAAHAAGVIHRDLKPDNLLLTKDPRQESTSKVPRLKIVDFGIAKLAGSGGKTATGMMLGTPAYMAPEQVAGRPPPSTATDVFAIGEVIYELLAHQRAYPAAAIHETVRAKLRGELPPLELPPVPGERVLKELIVRCLALKPTDRPQLSEVREILLSLAPWPELASARGKSESVAHLVDPRTRPWMDSLNLKTGELPEVAGGSRAERRREEGIGPSGIRDLATPRTEPPPSAPTHDSGSSVLDVETKEIVLDSSLEAKTTGMEVMRPPVAGRVPPPAAATELMTRIPALESSPTNPVTRSLAIPLEATSASEVPVDMAQREDTSSGEHTGDTPLKSAPSPGEAGERARRPSGTDPSLAGEDTGPRRASLPAIVEPWTDPKAAMALASLAETPPLSSRSGTDSAASLVAEPGRERRGRVKKGLSSTTWAMIIFLWLLAVGLVAISLALRDKPSPIQSEPASR